MILKYVSRIGCLVVFLLFTFLLISLGGNQRLVYADPLGSDIVCRVFTDLNKRGSPLPILDGGICPSNGGVAPVPPAPACSDGIDNDGDGLVDGADPGCSGASDTDEVNLPPAPAPNLPPSPPIQAKLVVVKVVINDNGGTSVVSDFSLNIATTSIGMADTIGVSSGATTTVAPGTWQVGEIQKSGYTATFGGACNSSGQVSIASGETKTCIIMNNDTVGAPPIGTAACADGIDNDRDGKIDAADPGCSSAVDNDETDLIAPPASPVNISAGSGSSVGGGGGGGSGGRSFGGAGLPAGTQLFTSTSTSAVKSTSGIVLGFSTTTESCERYLTAFIREGRNNDINQVRRLQRFLRDYEKAKVVETGIYDASTLAAVHVFQTKHSAEILSPWGILKSTGYVYLTTRKTINQTFCKNTSTFLLTTDELQKIEKARVASLQASSIIHVSRNVPRKTPAHSKAPTPSIETIATSTQSTSTAENRSDIRGARKFFRDILNRFR